ncbi:alpha/beta fold hydrolase [Qingshengfaniella alkalisoli]|uniref:Proline iminopeptidase n=1 Tax=Qingshengfaniella alkalisoli TaxID=2599296 RepID=A0A5B8J069_9RHOB|nr:alpha/beta hydrolase [Qingshengfaniella alkalisoli]QDY71183.1 alpha/beta fold hydrolase [Qingshengfaniella alkalisoli]
MEHNRNVCIAASLVAAVLGTSAQAQDADAPLTSSLERQDCATEALETLGAECYVFTGEENWDDPNGDLVQIPVAVFNADASEGNEPPVFFFPGGPGYSSLGNQGYLEQLLKDVGARTLVTMDHRGFIHADPSLRCPGYANVSPYHDIIHTPAITSSPDPLERIKPVAAQVEACYDKLVSEGVDPAQYNQYSVSRDVDEIRQHLGYDTIRPYGSSTGSGTALSYVQYFPEAVDAAVFGWPWFTHLRSRAAVDEFYTAKQRFTEIMALCVEQSEACRELHPDWMVAIDKARRALDEDPYVVEVEADGGETLHFDGAAFLDALYLMLPSMYAELPVLLNEVQAGDHSRLQSFFLVDDYVPETGPGSYALGYFLAHVCNDMGANRPNPEDSTAAIAREPAVLGFEPPWVCAWWGEDGAVPPEHNDLPRSDVPVLAIHGQMDPCCGPRWSEQIARTMPNVQSIVMQGLGHSPVNECRSQVIQAFLLNPSDELDTSCADEVPLESWVVE